MSINGKPMTQGSPWKHILRFAMPVLAGSLLQQLYNTVDTIIVGKFASEEALAAVGTTGSFTFLFLAIAIGFSSGNGVIVAQFYGAGRENKVRLTASTGIILILGMGLLSTILGLSVARPAFKYLVAVPDEIMKLTLVYFRVYVAGLLFQFGYNIFSSILRAVGDSAATLYFLLIASVTNIALDLLFVAVFKWGVFGAAFATVISQAGSFVAAYIYMIKKYPVFHFKLRDFHFDSFLAKRTLGVGFPIALQLMIVSFGLTFIQRAVNGFGKTMTASFTVGQRMEMYMNLPCNAFQTTLATYTGQNIGAGKMQRVKQGTTQTFIMSVMLTMLISVLVWVFADGIIGLFGISAQAAIFCRQHLRAIALVNLILSMYVPVFGVLQGANHMSYPTLVATCALGVRVAVTYLFQHSSFFGYTILWWNGLFGFGLGCLLTWGFYLSGRWQKNSSVAAPKE
ncbi:MAG: MATE family efflux transporter [Clostridia bacterium]|nr:MATE family efflux transporter [Clostridia bacterium]